MAAETKNSLSLVEQRTAPISISGLRRVIAYSHELATSINQEPEATGLRILAASTVLAAFKKASSHPNVVPPTVERVTEILAQDDSDRETDFLGKAQEIFTKANATETLSLSSEKQKVGHILEFQLQSE